MTKADVMAKLEEYKGRPIEIGLSDEDLYAYFNLSDDEIAIIESEIK